MSLVTQRPRQAGRRNRSVIEVMARDREGRKLCINCDTWKELEGFGKYKPAADGLSPRCGMCLRARRHGVTTGVVSAFSARGCMICGQPTDSPVIDHDHNCCPGDTGCIKCVRGTLCNGCNKGLGFFRDKPTLLAAAARYLNPKTRRRFVVSQKFRLEDYPLINQLEQAAFDELDRQYLNDEIESGTMESAYFDSVSGEIQGVPDFSKVIIAILEAFWEEEGR